MNQNHTGHIDVSSLESPDVIKETPKRLNMFKHSYLEGKDEELKVVPQQQQPKTDVPINVIARVRPLIHNEMRHPVCIEVVDDSIVNDHKTQIVVREGFWTPNQPREQKIYSFEKVLDPESEQKKVFNDVDGESLCNAFLNG